MLDKNRSEATPREIAAPASRPNYARRRRLPVRRVALVLALIAAAAAAWWWTHRPQAEPVPQTVAVTRGGIQQTVLATGALEASSVVSVGAQVSGPIKELYVKVGDVVKPGDPIAQIDSTQQQNAVKSAEAALGSAQAQLAAQEATLEQTEAALDRAKTLAGKNLLSQADLQTAKANYNVARAKIDEIKAQINQAQLAVSKADLDLSQTRIVAPTGGTIVAVLVSQGQQISAQQSSPTIVKIADLDTMVINAQISEADVTKVHPGQKVFFTILGDPDHRISATLRSINPAPDAISTEDTGISSTSDAIYYDGLFDVPNPDHKLRIAMTANVTIVLKDEPNALLVPAAAVHAGRNGGDFVLVYDPTSGEVRRQPVKVGINNNVMASIESGLDEGERVVTAGGTAASVDEAGGNRRNGGGRRFRGPFGF